MVAAPEGVVTGWNAYPDRSDFATVLDCGFSKRGYILSGLEDAGDLMHGMYRQIFATFQKIRTGHGPSNPPCSVCQIMFKPIIALILLAIQSALYGQTTVDFIHKGDDALRAGLWEMAALHYDRCLTNKTLTPAEKSIVAIRLAESWVRDGKPLEALALLEQSFASDHPEAPFWKGLALLATGRLTDAVTALTPLLEKPDFPYLAESGFTLESIQLALGDPEAALRTLDILARVPETPFGTKVRLHRVEILLDEGRYKEARESMPSDLEVSPAERPITAFLEAQLQLAEGRATEAAAGFQTLVDQPEGQSSHRYHLAAIGLVDALRAANTPDEAAAFLLSFITSHPDSPNLQAMFGRVLECLSSQPTITDPILERLTDWIAPSENPLVGAIAGVNSSAEVPWQASPAGGNELQIFAMFTRAIGLRRIRTPEARAEANLLLNRLQFENSKHPLATRALFETARWALEDGFTERAFRILDTLREIGNPPEIQGKAAFLEASRAYTQGDHKAALGLFEEAVGKLSTHEAKTASLNAAIVALSGAAGSMPVINLARPEDSAVAADLELERALATVAPDAKRAAIEEFLSKHSGHPREAEAHLVAAEAALMGSKPDLSYARAKLDTVTTLVEKSADIPPVRIAWIHLRICDLAGDSAITIATAREFLKQYPIDPVASDASFILGRNLFQLHNYNDARLVLEKLAASEPDSPRAQASWLLAARAAALVPTNQSQQEALTLFDKVIQINGSVSPAAMLEKGRLLIDMNRLTEAAMFLRKWFDSLKPADPLHLPAGLLLGEAIYAQGSANPTSLLEALMVYDKLLVHAEKDPAVFNRIQYLRGRTLEQMPDEKDPSKTQKKQAFLAYYSVLETTTPPAEWNYFEECGFKALDLLEEAGRWPAAIACAKKIASFKGPRAEKAANHASQLQLKHQIWED